MFSHLLCALYTDIFCAACTLSVKYNIFHANSYIMTVCSKFCLYLKRVGLPSVYTA